LSPKGRPTEDPKTLSTRIRLSEEDMKRLDFCVKETGLNRSEVIRQGIRAIYRQVKK